jgi:hypothetical protein
MLDELQAEAQTRIIEPYFSRDVPDRLYHYTDAAGLKGILCSREIHCTQVQYLNDEQELFHAAALVAERVREHLGLQRFGRVRTYAVDFASNRMMSRICVASFSEHGDDLGQWRSYGSGSNGYALGFIGEQLGEQTKLQPPTRRGGVWNLAPVEYEPDRQAEIADAIANLIATACNTAVDAGRSVQEAEEMGSGVFLSLVLTLGPMLKHPAFSAEREWRLVSPGIPHGHGHLGFRAGKLLTPYCRFQLTSEDETLALAEIVVGPGPHQQLNRTAAGTLRFEYGVAMPAEPRLSRVPYRDW